MPQAAYLAPNWTLLRPFLKRTPPLPKCQPTMSASAKGGSVSCGGGAQRGGGEKAKRPGAQPPTGDALGCDVVLRYETLAQDFPLLMRWAGLEAIRLNKPPAARRANASCLSRAGVLAMLDDDAKTLVQEMYAADYDLFEYPRDGAHLWDWADD